MEGSKRRSDWVPKIERSFEWSRLEPELLATAYERALPVVRRGRGSAAPRTRRARGAKVMEATTSQAAGA